ncbi:MAG: hypothetical protein CK424_08940 [Legionella sp.]|nr:MAG: hypothetical protein CK424_08940 [Legionella sp.]
MPDLPQAECIGKATELARSSKNVMDFMSTKLRSIVTKYRADDEYGSVLSLMDETCKVTELRHNYLQAISSKCWTATATPVDLENIKSHSGDYLILPAMEGVKELNAVLGEDNQLSNIVMAYYIDDKGQFNRGYVVNDQVVDEHNDEHKKMLDVIDKMFHSWLVSHNMASDAQGVIHHRKKNGDLGSIIKAEEVTELLNHEETGFQNTITQVDPNIQLEMFWSPPMDEPAVELEATQQGAGIDANAPKSK